MKSLQNDNYLLPFIKRQLSRLSTKSKETEKKQQRQEETTATVVIPFVEKTTQAIQRILKPLGIRVVGRSTQLKWSLQRRLKDSLNPMDEAGVVYAVKCKDCSNEYVGETARTARVRLAEHHSHARYGHLNMSAGAEHALCEGHDIDWKSAKILDREKNRRSRQVKEALWIKQKKTTLNKDKGMDIDKIWLTVL